MDSSRPLRRSACPGLEEDKMNAKLTKSEGEYDVEAINCNIFINLIRAILRNSAADFLRQGLQRKWAGGSGGGNRAGKKTAGSAHCSGKPGPAALPGAGRRPSKRFN